MKGMYMDMMGIIKGILGWIAQEIWRHFMMKSGRKAWEKACRDILKCEKKVESRDGLWEMIPELIWEMNIRLQMAIGQ